MLRPLAVVALILSSAVAQAQSWPQKPVRVIVSFAPGGASDLMPPLVATAPLKNEEIEKIRAAFLNVHRERALDEARTTLLVERFVVPELSDCDVTKRRAERVEREGEPWP